MNPRHVNPPADRSATASYNFVPLPEQILEIESKPEWHQQGRPLWQCHDAFVASCHSGWVELAVRALTPFFTGGEKKDRTIGMRCDCDGRVFIPGSTMRGMVRSLVEVLSFSKLGVVTDERPFFRTVGTDGIGKAYRGRMNDPQRGAGFLAKDGEHWAIKPATFHKISHQLVREAFPSFKYGAPPNYHPQSDISGRKIFVRIQDDRVVEVSLEQGNGLQAATLVLTGGAPQGKTGGKKNEFVFVATNDRSIAIPPAVLARFLSGDQISQWQEMQFPKGGGRGVKGGLKDGDPVFLIRDRRYLADESNPEGLFLGRAGMFRLPYEKSPRALIPEALRHAGIDMAEAIFGMVAPGKAARMQTIRGRVCFEDLQVADDPKKEGDYTALLSSPKATCYPQYLTQNGAAGSSRLTTYIEGDETTIRGTKIYWHRASLEPGAQRSQGDKQTTTMISPVAAGRIFSGRIRFDNLNDVELGALLSALRLPDGCSHRLGMGKSHGLGSVQVTAKLTLIDRRSRYSQWEDAGERSDDGRRFEAAFEALVLDHAKAAGECVDERSEGLRRIGRLDALYVMLTHPGPSAASITTMRINEFKHKHVLPSPHQVAGRPEPCWPSNPPKPGKDRDDPGAHAVSRQLQSVPARSTRGAQPKPKSTPKVYRCRMLDERTKSQKVLFEVLGEGAKGYLSEKSAPLPGNCGPEIDLLAVATGSGYWQLAVPAAGATASGGSPQPKASAARPRIG